MHSISFQKFFVQIFKTVVDSWKFTVIAIHLMRWQTNFYDFRFNEHLQQQLEYTLLKLDYNSWGISKMQSEREDTLEERYAIKLCFKLGKNATETYGMLLTAFGASCMNRAWDFEWHKRLRKAGSLWGMMRGVGGLRKPIHQRWLAKGLGLLCWGFKGV